MESTSHARAKSTNERDLEFFDHIHHCFPRLQKSLFAIIAFQVINFASYLVNLIRWTFSIPAPSATDSDTATTVTANGLALPSTSDPFYGPSALVLPGPGPVTASTSPQPAFYNQATAAMAASSQPLTSTPQATPQGGVTSASSGPSTPPAQVPANAAPLPLSDNMPLQLEGSSLLFRTSSPLAPVQGNMSLATKRPLCWRSPPNHAPQVCSPPLTQHADVSFPASLPPAKPRRIAHINPQANA